MGFFLLRIPFLRFTNAGLPAAAVAVALCGASACTPAGAQNAPAAAEADAEEVGARAAAVEGKIPAGQRVFVCGHSFHTFVAEPLVKLAAEARIAGHASTGVQFLGNSRPMEHWNLPDAKDACRKALRTGEVDVLTLAPHSVMPEPAVDLFAGLAFKHNPQARVMVQLSWAPFDGRIMGRDSFKNTDRDRTTATDLLLMRKVGEVYLGLMRAQVEAINLRAKREAATIVPVGTALMDLRDRMAAGKAPGFGKQSELFSDPMGHGAQPLKDLAAYCWFACLYRQAPLGLTALQPGKDETSRKRRRVLQEIAWEAALAEPASGVARDAKGTAQANAGKAEKPLPGAAPFGTAAGAGSK